MDDDKEPASSVYDEFLRVMWEILRKEESAWLAAGNSPDDLEYVEGTGPTFGRIGLIRLLREHAGLPLRDVKMIVDDYLARYPDHEYEQQEAYRQEAYERRDEEEANRQTEEQPPCRKWWQFWR